MSLGKPSFSIIIPSYNQGQYLEQAITSVLSQNYPNVELIIIDGGSQDSSTNIIKKYQSQIAYWVSEPDQGQSDAINKGFQKCRGKIVTFLSSDDYYLPDAFSDVAQNFLDYPNAGAVVGGFYNLKEPVKAFSVLVKPFLERSSPTDLSIGPPGSYRLHQVATFYNRQVLESVGFYVRNDLFYVMDRELLYRVCRKYPIILSDNPYGVFRTHVDSKSVSSILPFAKEFSNLYLESCTGEPMLDRKRKNMAKYRLSRGYQKNARYLSSRLKSIFAIIKAGLIYPQSFVSLGYWKKYVEVFSRQNN